VTKVADWLTPATQMPWPVTTPFRMRPNLEKLDPENPALLLRDAQFDAYRRLRENVFALHAARACVGAPNDQVLAAIANQHYSVGAALPRYDASDATADLGEAAPPAQSVALQLQEDFVILKNENDTLRTEYLSVCFPSRWDPREKLGLDFAAIHAPVADNQMLLAAGSSIMTMAFMKQPMLRHVWLIVPSSSLDQHPEQNDYSWSETLKDSSPLLPRLFFRVERQTTWPLPQLSRAVFFIRVMMAPLTDVLAQAPERARELRDALASMTPAVVEYRGMTAAKPRLLAELVAL
jgi:dimethylamine monooxygenase subunit A